MNIKNKYLGVWMLWVLVVLMCSFVSAFAVSSTYYGDNPFTAMPGESNDIVMTLQNLASDEDVKVRADISSGGEVISITDESNEYIIPGKGKVTVNLRVSVPEGAEVEYVYPVDIRFSTITERESGVFGLGSSIGKKFDVIVEPIPVPEEPSLAPAYGWGSTTVIIIVVVVVMLLIIWWLIRRKNK
jgi:hypothetical protein